MSPWKFWTWNDYYNDCMSFAKSLVHLKVDKFKIINILGFNAVRFPNLRLPLLFRTKMNLVVTVPF
jgi:long-subunit acyl-CoA synthetase (AMP-forming)